MLKVAIFHKCYFATLQTLPSMWRIPEHYEHPYTVLPALAAPWIAILHRVAMHKDRENKNHITAQSP